MKRKRAYCIVANTQGNILTKKNTIDIYNY